MPLNNGQATAKRSMLDAFRALQDCINYNLNCVKVATVLTFDPVKLEVSCRVNNKRLQQLKNDGNQVLRDYPIIYARAHFYGWGDVGSIYPIEPGMEGLLLFNDRELETWFTTSENGNLAYDRCHDLSDALFICGLHSQPKIPLVPYLEECLHIYYKNSDTQIRDKSIITNTTDYTLNASDNIEENTTNFKINTTTCNIKADTSYDLQTVTQTEKATTRNITATTNHSGTINSTVLNDLTAATGSFTSADGKTIVVVNGIVREIR